MVNNNVSTSNRDLDALQKKKEKKLMYSLEPIR